jgi:hypothetical protein
MSGFSIRRGLRPALLLLLCAPPMADAHIKWFANVDVSGDPLRPWQVMGSGSFAGLAALAIAVLAAAGWLDARLARAAAGRPACARWLAFDAGAAAFTAMRVGIAICFMAEVLHFRAAPVLLTPELKANTSWATLLPWTVALAALFDRPRLAAAGIVMLFVAAAADYGVFHLLDYPLFLGIALVLWRCGAGAALRARAMLVLRVAVALTFLWGGVEKWLYPEWTYPLLCGSGKDLAMGLPPDVFMQCAGFVEFCLAFVVLVGDLAARVAALLLVVVFVAAIPMFGAVDAVGHAPFMLALLVLAAQPNRLSVRFAGARASVQGMRWAAAFAAVLGVVPAFYFAAHQLAYGRVRMTAGAADAVLATALVGLVVLALPVVRALGRGRPAASGTSS